MRNISTYKKSREFVEQKPPRFIFITLIIIVVTLFVFIIFSLTFKVETVTKSTGSVSAKNSYQTVSLVTSTVESVNFNEGDFVEKGDVIIQLDDGGSGSDSYNLKASEDGIIHFISTINVGNIISSTQLVFVVYDTAEGEINKEVTVHIQSGKISGVDIGDHVNIKSMADNSSKYQYITGEVKEIGIDATYNESDGLSYYKVIISIDDDKFINDKGDSISLLYGMNVEVRIVTDEITLMNKIIKMLGLDDIF